KSLAVLLIDQKNEFKKAVGFFDLKTAKLARTVEVNGKTHAIALSPDGTLIFAGGGLGWFSQLIDANTGKEVGRVHSTPSLRTLAFSPDGKWVAGARLWNGAITVWELATRSYHSTSAEPVSFIRATFSPDSRNLVVETLGGIVDWRTGKII